MSNNGSVIPDSWVALPLGEAIEPNRPRASPRDHAGEPFVGLEHVEAHTTQLLGTVPAETMKSSAVRFQRHDVLYARMRPYLNKVWCADRDGLCSGEFIVFPDTPAICGAFLRYRLNAQDFVSFANRKTTGDRPRIDWGEIKSFPLLLPPRAEQERIIDRIDELFTDLDAGVAALARVKRNLARYRAAVLHAAVTGRLTADWRAEHGPADEPGEALLARILTERRAQWERRTLAKYEEKGKPPPKNWKSRYKEPAPPKIDDDLPTLPEGWCWATHDQIGDVQLGRQRSPKHHNGTHMRPYLRVANVYEDRIDTSDVLRMNFTPQEFETYALQWGDILLNEGQSKELIGRPAVYRDEVPGACFQNTLVRQRVILDEMADYAYTVIRTQYRAGRYRQIARITTSIAHLGAERFAAVEFPLPPLAEQAAIVELVQEKFSQIDALEAEVEHGLKRAGRLRQAILKAAFEGRLIPQDPSDEPASALLARLRAERELAVSKGSEKRRKRATARRKPASARQNRA